MRIQRADLLSGLLLALLLTICLVLPVSAGTGMLNGTDVIVESTPEMMPDTGIYTASEETIENITKNSPAVEGEENLIPVDDDSVTGEETEEELSLPESEPDMAEIVIEESDFNWEGEVTLVKGADIKYSPTTNLSAEYYVDAASDLAALLKASDKGGFDFYTDDSDYADYGTFWLTGINGVNNTADWSYYWSVYINGNATESGLSGNLLKDGDLLQFCYGYSEWPDTFPSPTNFTNIVNITVDVEQSFNWEGGVTLVKGADIKYSPTTNLSAEYYVDAASDLAALLKASDKGGFDFYTDDSDYADYGTFWLTGINGVNNTADWSYYWSVYINGNATESGLSGNLLKDGDLLQFCYGYSEWPIAFPSPTNFTNIVNITVGVEQSFNWDGGVSLVKGADIKYSPTTNLSAVYDVDAASDLAALLKASDKGGFDFYTDDSDYPDYGTFWLTGINGVNNTADWSYYWSVYINGNATESGLSGNLLKDGDLLQFCYGYSEWPIAFPSPTNFTNIVNITVDVEQSFNWEGNVILTEGPDFKYSPTNNSAAFYDVNATSDLAALLAAGEKGGFNVYTDDKWYSSSGTFWLEGIGDVNSSSDGHYYWGIYVNGNSAESGLSGNILKDGDLLQFCYGYSDWYSVFPSPTNFTNIVNITVNIEEYSGMSMLLPSKGMMEDTPYTAQIMVANITDASGLSTFLSWNPDFIDILNITANTSVFSGSTTYLNLTEGYAEVALTNTEGITTTTPAPVFDVEFRSKTGLHQETILLGTDTQYSDMAFINHNLPCKDGIFRIERVKGDFNGNGFVDIGDVSKVAYMVAEKIPVDMEADFNENGRVDTGDAAVIAWYFVGARGSLN